MPRFERIPYHAAEWDAVLETFPDRIVFQSAAWLGFVAESQRGEVVIAELRQDGEVLGYFAGVLVRKFGLRILGSPLRSWSTPYMGLCLRPSADRLAAFRALEEFAFREMRCVYFEVVDEHLTPADAGALGYDHEMRESFAIDLTQTEETLLSRMNETTRNLVRNAAKRGVLVEEATDAGFADEYAAQLGDVFAKQGLVPHFGAERVRTLMRHVAPPGLLLMLRAKDEQGRCIATGIFPAANRNAYFWGGASWREHQGKRPNEPLFWAAIQYWKRRGMTSLNLVGTMSYKKKFGGEMHSAIMVSKARYRFLAALRRAAPRALKALMQLRYLAGGKRSDG